MQSKIKAIFHLGLAFIFILIILVPGPAPAFFFNIGAKDEIKKVETNSGEKILADGETSPASSQPADKGNVSSDKATASTGIEKIEKKEGKKENVIPEADQEDKTLSGDSADQETDIMESALSLLDESQKYWSEGDIEDAVDLLDQAYSLILEVNGNPAIARQKDDLRLLIAKKILAIYTSRHVTTPGKRGEIPIIVNQDVEKEIHCFQTYEKDFFMESYRRSSMYRPIIVRELKKAGIPEELSWLPLVESGYKISALSRARALGLWQFIPSTGYKYELNRDEWIDERMDVEKSTRAAIAYLKDLHEMFGDWLTVLAAYNCGEGRVLRTISAQRINYLDRFWDLYHQLPYETARYVPRFLATILIVKDPKKYGMDFDSTIGKESIPPYELVKTNKSMRLQDIAQKIEVNEDQFDIMNAELRHLATPDREYELKVPIEKAEMLVKVVDQIPQWEKPKPPPAVKKASTIRHRVHSGETMASIARKYKTTQSAIRSYNNLSSNKVRNGQRLLIPRGYRYAKAKPDKENNSKTTVSKTYKIRKGDNLYRIAKQNNMSFDRICEINGLKKNTRVRTGQTITLD
ncbi:MAG: transglycosylase SLT domain-containing protein [Syntrophales bacterium]